MDMSKLPRPGESPAPPEETRPPAPRATRSQDRLAGAAEVWISAALGVILMLMGQRFGLYLLSLATRRPFSTGAIWQSGPKAGTEVAYAELQGFAMLTDASVFLFGLVLLIDAAVLYFATPARLWLVWFGLALTGLVTMFNIFVALKLFANQVTPILSLLAVAFGIYLALQQWRLIFRRSH